MSRTDLLATIDRLDRLEAELAALACEGEAGECGAIPGVLCEPCQKIAKLRKELAGQSSHQARYVYADWLEEREEWQEAADLIRVELRLAELPLEVPATYPMLSVVNVMEMRSAGTERFPTTNFVPPDQFPEEVAGLQRLLTMVHERDDLILGDMRRFRMIVPGAMFELAGVVTQLRRTGLHGRVEAEVSPLPTTTKNPEREPFEQRRDELLKHFERSDWPGFTEDGSRVEVRLGHSLLEWDRGLIVGAATPRGSGQFAAIFPALLSEFHPLRRLRLGEWRGLDHSLPEGVRGGLVWLRELELPWSAAGANLMDSDRMVFLDYDRGGYEDMNELADLFGPDPDDPSRPRVRVSFYEDELVETTLRREMVSELRRAEEQIRDQVLNGMGIPAEVIRRPVDPWRGWQGVPQDRTGRD